MSRLSHDTFSSSIQFMYVSVKANETGFESSRNS